MLSGYEFYKVYFPLHLHFTTSYDVFKYSGRLQKTVNINVFNSRKDKPLFESWGNRSNGAISAGHLTIANFIYSNDDFIYNEPSEAFDVYKQWKTKRESTLEVFKYDCIELQRHFTKVASWDAFLHKTNSGKTAPLLQLYQFRRIHPESIIILDSVCPFIDAWGLEYAIDPMISTALFKLQKYRPFVKIDADNVNKIFQECISSNVPIRV